MLVKEAMEQYNNKIKEKGREKKIKKKNSYLKCFFLCTCNSFLKENWMIKREKKHQIFF